MRNAEIAFALAVVVGLLFKIMHWPGASVLIVSGGGLLALFYFPFGYRTLPTPRAADQLIWLSLLGGLSLCAALSAQMAFILHWPFSRFLLTMAVAGCGVSLLAATVIRYRNNRLDLYLEGIILRCLVLGFLALVILVLFSNQAR
ncbi:MAG: hypothetical protein QM724_02890 [Flavobacteriales bacterium]